MPFPRWPGQGAIAAALLCAAPGPLAAHEFWIDPLPLRDGRLLADYRVGDMLLAPAYPWLDATVAEAVHVAPDGTTTPLSGRNGDLPALDAGPVAEGVADGPAEGVHILATRTRPAYVTFGTLAEFRLSAAYEGLDGVADAHLQRGLAPVAISEEYLRDAKALVAVGAVGADGDRPVGLPFELVLEGAPFAGRPETIDVRLLWEGEPEGGVQVALFHRPDAATAATRTLARTEADGRARFASMGPGEYLLNAVRMVPVDGPGAVRWQSRWASLTFTQDG